MANRAGRQKTGTFRPFLFTARPRLAKTERGRDRMWFFVSPPPGWRTACVFLGTGKRFTFDMRKPNKAKLIGTALAVLIVLRGGYGAAEPGFDPRYERDYNIFNPMNQYRPDNPLNPINKVDPDNPFNPINRVDPDNPVNPLNRVNPNNSFNPINKVHPDNPFNPVNKFNPDTPFAPLDRLIFGC